jgi:hypothetical protein
MRKLKLQICLSLDGYVAGPEGQLDWMVWDQDEKLLDFIAELADTSDTILMGRKMAPGYYLLGECGGQSIGWAPIQICPTDGKYGENCFQ